MAARLWAEPVAESTCRVHDRSVVEYLLRGFSGEVARNYARYRRGYPPAVIDSLVRAFALNPSDIAIDLGCGTGQLTLPLASTVRSVIGVDPEPDMLGLAADAARAGDVRNVSWMLGFESDLATIGGLLLPQSVGAITVATAIHWMNSRVLFRDARPLLRDGGGIAIVTNGTPLWLQDTDWSRVLRSVLEEWTGRAVTSACGTDEAARDKYATELSAAGYMTSEVRIAYDAELDLETLIGGLFSAMSPADVDDPARRRGFADRVRGALAPDTHFRENVQVTIQTGTLGS